MFRFERQLAIYAFLAGYYIAAAAAEWHRLVAQERAMAAYSRAVRQACESVVAEAEAAKSTD